MHTKYKNMVDTTAPNPQDLAIFKSVAEIMATPEFNDANAEFFKLNADKFEDNADENKHEYMQLFEEYLSL